MRHPDQQNFLNVLGQQAFKFTQVAARLLTRQLQQVAPHFLEGCSGIKPGLVFGQVIENTLPLAQALLFEGDQRQAKHGLQPAFRPPRRHLPAQRTRRGNTGAGAVGAGVLVGKLVTVKLVVDAIQGRLQMLSRPPVLQACHQHV